MYLKTCVICLCFFVYFPIANAVPPKLSEKQLLSTYSLIQWTHKFGGQGEDVTRSRVESYLKTKLKVYKLTLEELGAIISGLPDTHILEERFLTIMGYGNNVVDNVVDTSLPMQVDLLEVN